MSNMPTTTLPEFAGSAKQQELARQVYETLLVYGVFFPREAPIRQTRRNLAEYLASQSAASPDDLEKKIDAAVAANPAVFLREERDGEVFVVTSRAGHYVPPRDENTHTFAQRLYEPEHPLPIDDLSVVITTVRPALTTVEPVFISDYWREQASAVAEGVASSAEDQAETEPQIEAQIEAQSQPEPVADLAIAEEPVVAAPATEAAPPRPAESAPLAAEPTLTVGDLTLDLRRPIDELMAELGPQLMGAVRHAIDEDPLRRIVSFGRSFYPEDEVHSFSKGDYRRIREYIIEQGEPIFDTAIMQDLFGRSQRDRDAEAFRFALNYRLNREKDFEFVGVEGARLWSAKGLATIGTKRLKASELGQLFAFLEEGYDDSLGEADAASIAAAGQITRYLSFFEWEYGLLPLDAAIQALLPNPLVADQRSAVLRVELPQHYVSALVELRFATGNRGGWLQGLEELFHEFLVPGALITLAATEEPNVFTLQYEVTAGEELRLLTLDEKKGRYAFNPREFYCAVDAELTPSQERLPRLRNMKLLAPGDRRRLEATLAHVFETVGQGGPEAYTLSLEDALLAATVQRPASRSVVLHTLENDARWSQEDAGWVFRPVRDEADEAQDADYEEE